MSLLYPVFHSYGLLSLKTVRLVGSWAVQREGCFVRLRSVASAFAFSVALVAASTQTALADPPPNPGPPELTVTVQDAAPEATSCEFYASQPKHSGSRMTGTGGISTCSGGPVACTSEVDLEYYSNTSSMWYTTGTARQSLCAPPLRSSTAAATCVNHTGDPNRAFRTTTYGTFVTSSGTHASGVVYSDLLYVPCT